MMKRFTDVLLALFAVVSLFPFCIVFMMSTYYTEDLFKGMPVFPSNYLLENLKTVFKTNFIRVYCNSAIVSVTAVLLSCLFCALIGFAIAKYDFKLKRFFNNLIIIIMMVPTQISIIGYILEMRSLGLINTLVPIILCWAAFPFGAFFMTQFIKDAIPDEILECARLDGCWEPRIFSSIVIPLIKPGIVTLATLVFLWSWNNYMLPLIIINKQEWYTIPLLISTLGIAHRTDHAAKMCALALSIFPMALIFLLGSKTFIKGITAGAIKG